ncbi:Na+/H+ antiporter [Spirosoma agri]|uniref:Na+/H+ antiporter n=1 Tax=Spirosoma agri TaxID=1987381 RepID=A0A6M0IHE7_9BACT|nr:Na+/H+ antiporter [Spirosoma agri]NEU67115.1 Na+/H+ antiporter [Spirosoma agri]
MHSLLPFLLAMVAAIVLLNLLATKLKIAYPILLVVAGLLVSFLPGLPRVAINPNLIFFVFLPPLLFEAAWTISFKEMKKWWRMIGSFAFVVVFFTALSVALVVHQVIPGFTLALGFLLGGIVSSPDAVSTGAITKFVRIPKYTSAVLEGESLLNDASSLIIFRFALVAIGTGQFVWQEATLDFIWMVVGGTGMGLLIAWLFVQVHKRLPLDTPSSIALTLIEPYCMYWVAEQFHGSGVLAVVSGGLFMSSQRLTFLDSASRIQSFSVWESFVFILNGVVFLLIGLELAEIVDSLQADGIPLPTAIGYGLLVTGVLIGARILSAYAALISTLVFRPGVIPRPLSTRMRWLTPILLGWTGMRGVVSLAAALAIPVTLNTGQAFPQRSLILFITFVVILLTLIVQGLTLPSFIRRSKLYENLLSEEDETLAKQKLHLGLKQHTYQFLKSKSPDELTGNPVVEKLLSHWEERTNANDASWMDDKKMALFQEMLASQRRYLADLNHDPTIDEALIRQQLYQIDLEEERLKLLY